MSLFLFIFVLISAVRFSFILCLMLEKIELTMEKQPQNHLHLKINEVITSEILWNLRPCLYGVKMSQVERSPASLNQHFPTKPCEPFT